jgi:Na+/phosphate symporter
MVRTGVLRAFGGELRGRLGRSMNHRLTAFVMHDLSSIL